jgi:hypothetical protein
LQGFSRAKRDRFRIRLIVGRTAVVKDLGYRGGELIDFGLAMAGGILLATLSLAFTNKTESSTVIRPAQQDQIVDTLEHDAQVVSNAQLEQMLAHERSAVRQEVLRINRDSINRALQVALLVPMLASGASAPQFVPDVASARYRAVGRSRG